MSTIKSSAENLTLNADGANNDVIIQSNGSTKVTVDGATGNLGVGESSPDKKLSVTSATVTDGIRLTSSDTGGEGLSIEWESGYSGGRITGDIESDASGAGGNLTIRVADTSAALQNRLHIDNAGDVTVNSGDIVFGTAGKGIVLGATTNVDANTLDDYEEGTWTPTIGNFTVNSGTWAATGRYIRIGNSVTVSMHQTGGNVTWAANKQLGGLPFAPISGLFGAGSFTNGAPNIGGEVFMYNSGSTIYFAQSGSSQTSLTVTATYILT